MALMANTMIDMAKELEGCIFAYQQSDEVTFVLRNDQSLEAQPWFDNRIQKMASISGAMATDIFKDLYDSLSERPDLEWPALFDARAFGVPSMSEVANNLVFRQQDCIRNAVTNVVQTELAKRFGTDDSSAFVNGVLDKVRHSLGRTED